MNESHESDEGKVESTDGLVGSPAATIEVSRSPSPSNSPIDHAPAGRGSFSSFKSLISEEERSPSEVKNPCRSLSSLAPSFSANAVVDNQEGFYPIDSEDVEMIDDVSLDDFSDEIEVWIIDAFKKIGLDTAKGVLSMSREDLVDRTDLEEETIDEVVAILSAEFE